jgi:hypothetical protein
MRTPLGLTPWGLALVFAYLLTRFYALTLLPIFMDESVHIRWAFNIAEGERLLRPWADGRLLSVWLDALVVPFSKDVLWASRALTVLFGGVTLFALLGIGRLLYGEGVALWAGWLYVFCPFTLFHDRLVLADSFLTSFATLTLLASIELVRGPAARKGFVLGVLLTLGVLTKFSGILLFLIPILTVVFLGGRRVLGPLLAAYATALLFLLYPLVLFSRTAMLSEVVSEAGGAGFVGDVLLNVRLVSEYLGYYWTPPLVALGIVGIVLAFWKGSREGLLLSLLAVLPLAAVVLCLRVWFPRYILWATVPFLLLASRSFTWGIERLKGLVPSPVSALALLVFLWPSLRIDFRLWTDPPAAGLPGIEGMQYINGWPSGYGVEETVAFFRQALERYPKGFTVMTHALGRRTTWYALDLYFQDEPRIDLETADLGVPEVIRALSREATPERPIFVVVSPKGEGAHKTLRGALASLGQRDARFLKPDGAIANEIFRLDRSE